MQSGGADVGFETYDAFEPDPSGGEFRVFGTDAGGGTVAFWPVHAGRPVEEQPVVFMESEGFVGAVAADLGDFLHLLAAGFGPEAAMDGTDGDRAGPRPRIARIAGDRLGGPGPRAPEAVLAAAEDGYSDVKDRFDELWGHEPALY